MLNKILFASALGVSFGTVCVLAIPQPYTNFAVVPGALALGWFSQDILDYLKGVAR